MSMRVLLSNFDVSIFGKSAKRNHLAGTPVCERGTNAPRRESPTMSVQCASAFLAQTFAYSALKKS